MPITRHQVAVAQIVRWYRLAEYFDGTYRGLSVGLYETIVKPQ